MKNIIIAVGLTGILAFGFYYFKPDMADNHKQEHSHSHDGEEPHSH